MKKGLPFKLLIILIILISCAFLAVSVPVLIKILTNKNPQTAFIWTGIYAHLTNFYAGLGVGVALVIFSMLRLDNEKQIQLVRFLLILGTMLTAITYILLISSS